MLGRSHIRGRTGGDTPEAVRLVAVAVLGGFLAMAVGATPTPFASSPALLVGSHAGAAVAAGARASVAWSGLPAGVDELELLLSVDGGRSYPIRLTPQLDPASGTLLWDVPNLPSGEARLRVRYGIDHREFDGPQSAPFAISGASGRPVAPLEVREGELWPGKVPLPGRREGKSRLATPADVTGETPGPGEADPPPTWSLSPGTQKSLSVARMAANAGEDAQVTPFPRRPRTLPLRR
jgi:hypothetical protein